MPNVRNIPTGALTAACLASLAVAVAALIGYALVKSHVLLAFGLVGLTAASWFDRWRVGRVVSARYVRVLSYWQADVDALANGGVRPNRNRLDPPTETTNPPRRTRGVRWWLMWLPRD